MSRSAVMFLGAALLAGHPHAIAPAASSIASLQPAPAAGTWSNIASPSFGRHILAAAVGADGRVYASGGQDVIGNALSLVEAYDPGSNTWSAVSSLPEPRYGHASVSLNGLIYVIGGSTSYWTSSSVRVYNPGTNTWSSASSMVEARYFPAALVVGGKIYVAGGGNDAGVLASAEVYDPATDHWTAIASMHHARYFYALASGPDGRLYAIGGYDQSWWTPLASVEAYDPATNQWTDVASLPAPRAELGAATGADGVIYAIGGATPATTPTTLAYDGHTNTWTDAPSMNQARHAHAVAGGADGTIYAIDGEDGTYQLTSAEAFGTAPKAAPTVTVTVKVKSGDNAPINRRAQGNVPVAVFSTGTFDATKIDRSTVSFAGAPALPIGDAPADLNGDGLADVVLHFSTQALSLPDGTTQACISGKTTNGKSFQGCDSVRLVK